MKTVVFSLVFILVMMLIAGCATTKEPIAQYRESNLPALVRGAGDTTNLDPLLNSPPITEPENGLSEQPRITNLWEEKDIATVLEDIAGFIADSGINILWDDTIEGKITLKLDNVPLEQALEKLKPKGYVFKKLSDNLYVVGSGIPGTSGALALSEDAEVVITNRPADEVASLLSSDLTPFVKTIKGGHLLSINGPKSFSNQIKKDLASLDPVQPLVTVEVLVTEIKKTKRDSIGINWSEVLNISADIALDLKRETGWTYTSGLKSDIDSSIQALSEQGSLELLADPKVVCVSGEEAQIEVSREEYIILESAPANNNNLPYYYYGTRYEAKPISSGVILKVKPQVLRNGKVALFSEASVSDLDQSNNNKLPTVQKRSTKTVVIVKSGDTVVIGGLHQKVSREVRKGLPVLGKIPVLNFLFSKKEIEEQDTELVIFVTPVILK